ncbi:MAG: autotransporter-associated beta strand repeat-containing protein [Prosthecobacter sp.]
MMPKNSLLRRGGVRRLFLSLNAVLALATAGHADTLVWDTNTGAADAQDGTGTWTAGSPNWFNQTQTLQNQSWANGSDAVFGAGNGVAGTILLSGPITAGSVTFNAGSTAATYALGGTGTLTLVNSTITNNAAGAISAIIAGSTPWTKTGAGTLTLNGATTNTHSGLLTVNQGTLALAKTGGNTAVAGNLAITGGAFVTLTAGTTNQIAPTAAVSMSGAASVFHGTGPNAGTGTVTQTLASLTITGGTFNTGANSNWTITGAMSLTAGAANSVVFVGNSGMQLSVGSLSLAGMNGGSSSTAVTNGFTVFGNTTTRGTVTVGAGGLALENSTIHLKRGNAGALGSRLVLNGDVTTAGTTTSLIRRDGTETEGLTLVELGGTAGSVSRAFNIAGGGANLNISVSVTNGAATTASVVKSGAGTLIFSGGEANSYTGETTINAGTLQLNKTAGVTAVAGNIIVNTGGTLTLGASNQIADGAGITVNGGTITAWGTDEMFAYYTQNSGGGPAAGNTGHVTLTGALTLAGGNTLTINSGSATTPPSWNVGSAVLTGADILIGGNNGAGGLRTTLTIGAGGLTMAGRTITLNVGSAGVQLNLNGDFTGTGTNNINNGGGAGVQPLIAIGAATRTFNVINGTTAISAEITGAGGSLVKTGAGVLQLTTANSYTGSTTVSGGILSLSNNANVGYLNGTTAVVINGGGVLQSGSSTPAINNGLTNRINSAATLTLGGGTFTQFTAATGAYTQSLVSLNVNGGANTVNVTAAASTTNTLTFTGATPYTRTAGLVNFVQNAAVGGSVVFTNAPSGAGNVSGGALVGATLNGTDLVAAQPGVLTAFSGWVPTGTGTWTPGAAMDVTGTNGAAYAGTNITALRFNTAGPFTVTLDGTHTIDTDVILMTSSAGAGTSIVTGGTLQGTAGGDLAIVQHNTTGSLEIASAIANNTTATGLVKSGGGLLILSGTNTYTGVTRVNEGVLRAADGMGLSAGSALVLSGGVFESSGATFTRALGTAAGEVSLVGGASGFSAAGTAATFNLGGSGATLQWGGANFNPTTLVLNNTTATAALELANGIDLNGATRGIRVDANVATVSGFISNSATGAPAGLTKTGAGTLRLTQANTYDGSTTVSAGLIALGHNQALGAGTVTLAGGGLQADGAARTIANNVVIAGAAAVTSAQNLTLTGSVTNSGASTSLTTNLTGGAVLEIAGNVYLSESAATARTLQIFGSGDRLISGVIANNAGSNTLGSNLFFNGGGTLTLAGTNTYTGRTLAAGGGYIVLNQDRSLGAVPVTPMTDALILAGSSRIRASTTFTLDANRGIGIGNSGGGTATGQIDVVANAVFTVAGTIANRTMNHDGTASTGSNVGSLTKTGTGVLELSGNNTYSGLTTVSNGILRLKSNTALGATTGGTVVASTGHMELADGVVVTGETVTINSTSGTTGPGSPDVNRGGLQAAVNATAEWAGDVILGTDLARLGAQEGGTLTISGNITDGASSFILRLSGEMTGRGGLVLSGTGNAWDGETEIVRGRVFLGAHNTLPTTTVLDIHFTNSNNAEYAGLDMNGFNQTISSLRNDGNTGANAELTNSSRTLSTLTVNEAGNTTYTGVINGNVALVKNGTGTMILTQANRLTGGITVNDGILRISNATALAEGDVAVNGGTSAGGKLDINNLATAVDALNGSAGTVAGIIANESTTSATRIFSVGVNHGGGSYAGQIVDNTGGAALGRITVAKIGTGTQTLSGTGTHTGGTLVSNGTLVADFASGSPLGSSTVSLQGGTLVVRNATTTTLGNISLVQGGSDFSSNVLRIEGNGTVTTPTFTASGFAPLLLDISSGSTFVASALGAGTTVTSGVLMGASGRSTLFVQDSSGTGFATRNGSNQIVRYASATTLDSAGAATTGTTNYVISADLTRTATLNFQTLQIDTATADVTLNLGANNLVTGANGRTVLITGNNDATIAATTGAATSGSLFIANYGTGVTTLDLSLNGQALVNIGTGLVNYTHSANTGDLYAAGGVTRLSGADRDFSTGITRIYGGGVLEIGADLNGSADGAFTRAVGQALAGQVALVGNGGFSAHGADRVVALGGTAAPAALTWGASSFLSGPGGDNNHTFMLGSAYSTHTLEFQNAINLGTRERRIEVADGTSGTNTDARLTGVISGNGGSVVKEGMGRLEFTAANTYTGRTDVNAGSLVVASTGRTGTGAVSVASGAALMGSGLVQGSSFTLAANAALHAGNDTTSASIGTLTFQTAAKASFEIQNGSSVTLDIQSATNQGSIDPSFGGSAIGSAGYNAFVDAFAGTGAGTHDLLVFNGANDSALTFGGNLTVRPEGLNASMGQVFNLLDWTTLVDADFTGFNVGANFRTGGDDNLLQFDLPELSGGLLWDISRFTSSGVIVVVPEPGRALLLMLGMVSLVFRRRRL